MMRARPGVLLGALACAALMPLAAGAKKIYKFVDAQGITHYTDQKPEGVASEIKVIGVRARGQNPPACVWTGASVSAWRWPPIASRARSR